MIRLSLNKSTLLPLFVIPGVCLSVRSEFVDPYINVTNFVNNNNSAVVYFGIEVICCITALTVEFPTCI